MIKRPKKYWKLREDSLTLILEEFLTSILNSVGVQYGLQDNLSFWPPKTMWLWWILNEINDFIGAPALKRCSPRSHKRRLAKLAKWPISSIDVTLLSVILGLDYTSEWVVPVTQTFVFQFFEVCIFSDWLLELILIDYSSSKHCFPVESDVTVQNETILMDSWSCRSSKRKHEILGGEYQSWVTFEEMTQN